MANNKEGNLYLSLHFNEAFNKTIKGIEIYYYDTFSFEEKENLSKLFLLKWKEVNNYHKAKSKNFALSLEKELLKIEQNCQTRGIPFIITLKGLNMPAVMVELGFLSNPEDSLKFDDIEYIDKLSYSLFLGIYNFIKNQ